MWQGTIPDTHLYPLSVSGLALAGGRQPASLSLGCPNLSPQTGLFNYQDGAVYENRTRVFCMASKRNTIIPIRRGTPDGIRTRNLLGESQAR